MSKWKKGSVSLRARGVTLVELIVMSVIASLVALTIIQGFSGINRGILSTRFKTIATELANDRMQVLKNTSYFRLRISSQTVVPAALASFSPPLRSDTTNYPPTTTTVRGVPFTFYTVVERVQRNDVSDDLEVINWDSPDTGLKKMTIEVVWQEQNSWKRLQLNNVLENPNRSTATGDFGGTVRDTSSAFVPGVLIDLAENPSFSTLTDSVGSYRLGAPAGTYTLRASKRGYFSQSVPNSVIAGSSTLVTVNFTNFLAMSSGTIAGTVWQNTHLVISRICGKTAGSGHEYVEIFNPTTWTWTVDGAIGLKFQRTAAQDPAPLPITIDYAGGGNTIQPGGFYLFGCNPIINVDGTLITADASWDNAVGSANYTNFPYFDGGMMDFNIIPTNPTGTGEGVGTLTLYEIPGGTTLDMVGWKGAGSFNPGSFETAPIPGILGMEPSNIYYRKSDVAGVWSTTVGPAYDSGNNSVDWAVNLGGLNLFPRKTSSPPLPVTSGTPSAGAFVFADDGLSLTSQAALAGSPPEARFTLPSVATGTWTVSASSGNYFTSFSTSVTGGVTISTGIILASPTVYGFVSGYVKDAATSAGINGISITPGATVTDAAGFFRAGLSPGLQTITANLGRGNPLYTETTQSVAVGLGQIDSDINFFLSGAGKITGRVTLDGLTPIPDVSVEISNTLTGYALDNITTAIDGSFSASVPVGSYIVRPALASGETVSPAWSNTTLTAVNSTVFSATFTVTSSFGALAGTFSTLGKPISTGVLIIASTAAVPALPPTVDKTFRGAGNLYYLGASLADGTYSISLASGTYRVSAWYTTFSGGNPTVTRKDQVGVVVTPRNTTSLNLSW